MPMVAPYFPPLALTCWPVRKPDLHYFLNSPTCINSFNSDQGLYLSPGIRHRQSLAIYAKSLHYCMHTSDWTGQTLVQAALHGIMRTVSSRVHFTEHFLLRMNPMLFLNTFFS